MAKTLFELLYTSVAPKGLSKAQLRNILENSRLKNRSLGITGMLVCHEHEIMQILEGDESHVKELYETISKDNRHVSVEIVYQGEIENRSFPDWSMALKMVDEFITKDPSEAPSKGLSHFSNIANSQNYGHKAFLSLRDTL